MNYYSFHIGDYKSHTEHLEPLEDLAFRRMIDWCYLHEKPLPIDIDEIARLIRMRSHNDCIAYVLQEFFVRNADGYINKRISREISKYQEKSHKAKKSAEARWKNKASKNKGSSDANAYQTQCESNANQEPRTKNQEPRTKSKARPSSQLEVLDYMKAYVESKPELSAKNPVQESEGFFDYYSANGWKAGRNAMKDWQAAARNWIKRSFDSQDSGFNQSNQKQQSAIPAGIKLLNPEVLNQ